MQLSQVISRSTVAAIMTCSVALGASVNAEPIRVTRGPNGATHVVNSDNIPVDAKLQPKTAPHDFPTLVERGPSGAFHIVNESKAVTKSAKTKTNQRLITRGPNGAGFFTNK